MLQEIQMIPLTMGVEEAAKWIGASRGRTYELVRCGQLPSYRVGRKIRINKASLLKFMGIPVGLYRT